MKITKEDIGRRIRLTHTDRHYEQFGILKEFTEITCDGLSKEWLELFKNHPVLLTDDGEEILGMECFWTFDD